MNLNNEKFDIIILAGQSNAEGNGITQNNNGYKSNGKIMQLVDSNPAYIYEDPVGSGNGKIVITLPTHVKIELAHDRIENDICKCDLSSTFVESYINKGLLKSDRKILIIKCAIGGSGFAKKQWGVGNVFYNRLLYMVNYAISLNKDNKIVAFLWHQGEHDAFENNTISEEERYSFYYKSLNEQMIDFFSRFNYRIPFIAGEFVNDWASTMKLQCDTIEKAINDVCIDLGYSHCVSSEGLLSNNQVINNGDNIHFCYQSIKEMGIRYFNAYFQIVNNENKFK